MPQASKNALLQMRVNEDFIRQVDEWRRHQEDIPTRGEAVRRLLLIAFEVEKKRKRDKKLEAAE